MTQSESTVAREMLNVIETAYTLYHPFLGLESWKEKVPASAFYHSLSTSVIAGSITELLTDNEDEIYIAIYGGLIHDLYQKGLNKEVAKNIVNMILGESGLDKKIIDEVLESANYNIAENPSIWSSKHPEASLGMWLADVIASSPSALDIYYTLLQGHGKTYKLSDAQQKLLQSLTADIITITIPQTVLRSTMYRIIIEKMRREDEKLIPVIARGGLIIIRKTESPIDISIVHVLNEVKDDKIIENLINIICGEGRACRERLEPLKFEINKLLYSGMFRDTIFTTEGVKLFLPVDRREVKYRCMTCGLPVHDDGALHAGVIGYFLYGETRLERWNPRLPAISQRGMNLNRIVQHKRWKDYGIIACPLCALDAFQTQLSVFEENRLTPTDYFIQFYLVLPTHYDLARYLARLAHKAITDRRIQVGDILEDRGQFMEAVRRSLSSAVDKIEIIDATWLVFLKVVRSVANGEVKDFAHYLPLIAKAILATGVYPAKLTRKPDPHVGDRIIMPTYPLYDYSLTDKGFKELTPLVIIALSIINMLDDEIVGLRGGRLDEESRIRATLDYIRHPFKLCQDLLARHSIGRKTLNMYKRFIENPLSIYRYNSM